MPAAGLYHESTSHFRGGNVNCLLYFALLMTFSLPSLAAECPAHHTKDAHTLIEQAWAKALELHDAGKVGCILADEFQDADPEGKLHNRTETLAHIPNRHPGRNVLSELNPHLFGDSGYVRGLATLIDPQGKIVARVRFTDIFIYRNQRWLAVAGQETLLPESEK